LTSIFAKVLQIRSTKHSDLISKGSTGAYDEGRLSDYNLREKVEAFKYVKALAWEKA